MSDTAHKLPPCGHKTPHLPPPGEPYTTEYCRICWHAQHSPEYQDLWGLPRKGLPRLERQLRCRHLGAAVGAASCPSCRGHVQVKTFACAFHGRCTPEKKIPGVMCCKSCTQYAPLPNALVHLSAAGIGDALLGLTAVCGLKHDQPDRHVTYAVTEGCLPWVRLFPGPDEVVITSPALTAEVVYRPYENSYGVEVSERGVRGRADLYAAACNTTPRLPAKDLVPLAALAEAHLKWGGHVALVPFASWSTREWPLGHWLALEGKLRAAGRQAVIVDGNPSRCAPFSSPVASGNAAQVAACLKVCAWIVTADSGMAHLAGLLGTPTLALCGPTRGECVFGIYPSVKVLQAPLGCTACYWHPEVEGFVPEECPTRCANLERVTPEEVLGAIQGGTLSP